MGTCYSRQGQLHVQGKEPLPPLDTTTTADNMPHTISEESPGDVPPGQQPTHKRTLGGFGFRHPQNLTLPSKNSNEQSNRDGEGERTTLGTITNGDQGATNTAKPNGGSRFGFAMGRNKDKSNSKKGTMPTSESSDSVQSADNPALLQAQRPSRSGSLPSSKQPSLKKAYIPRSNTGSWRMIDDSSSVYSGWSGRPGERGSRSDTVTPCLSQDDLDNGNSASSTPVRSATTTVVEKAPIAAMESLDVLSVISHDECRPKSGLQKPAYANAGKGYARQKRQGKSGGQTNGHPQSNGQRGDITRHRTSSQSSTEQKQPKQISPPETASKGQKAGRKSQKVSPVNKSQKVSPENKSQKVSSENGQAKPKGNKGTSFLRKGFLRKQKPASPVPEASKSSQSENDSPPKPADQQKVSSKADAEVINETIVRDLEPVITREEGFVVSKKVEVLSKTPAAINDSAIDTISMGSIHSDDLMLDMDDAEDLGASASHSLERSKYSGRPRSRSRSDSRSASYDRRTSGAAVERVGSMKKERCGSATRLQSSSEPLEELASLVEASSGGAAQRRQQRLQKATRPVSFPGPRSRHGSQVESPADPSGPHGGSLSMKPPRQGSVCDDDQVSVDGFLYRHMVQDVTTLKTMVLKLKRVIQDEEFQGQNLKNGFKCSSQPTSPYDDTNKFNFAALLEAEEGVHSSGNVDDVIKENAELKMQNQSLLHQLEEQERTIKLLQQQMTKYECGYSEPGGRGYTHAATQTDKQLSGFYKSTGSYRTACARRTSSTSSHQGAPRFRTEFRASGRSTSSMTANDEVFLDEMLSYDNDDDLDLLMEEVSLGSDAGSVADLGSQYGSFHGSVSSSAPAGGQREASLTRASRGQSLTHYESVEKHSSQLQKSSGPGRLTPQRSQRSVSETDSFIPESHSLTKYGHVLETDRAVTSRDTSRSDSQTSQNTNSNNMSGLVSPQLEPQGASRLSSASAHSSDIDRDCEQTDSATTDLPSGVSSRHSPDGSTSGSIRSPAESLLACEHSHSQLLRLSEPETANIEGSLALGSEKSVTPVLTHGCESEDQNGNRINVPCDEAVGDENVPTSQTNREAVSHKHLLTKQDRLISSDTVDQPQSSGDGNRNTLTKFHSVPSDTRTQQEVTRKVGSKLMPPRPSQRVANKQPLGDTHAASAEGGFNYLRPPTQKKTFGPQTRSSPIKDTVATGRILPSSGIRKPQASLGSQEFLPTKKRRQLPTISSLPQQDSQYYGTSGTRLSRPPYVDTRANTIQAGGSVDARPQKTVRGRPYSKT